MHIAQMRSQVSRLAALANVLAISPLTPTERASSCGDSVETSDATPNVTTQKNTKGTRKRNARNASAADMTPPPAALSRSNALNAVSIVWDVGRADSSRS